jgi:Uma2 family endonuclease
MSVLKTEPLYTVAEYLTLERESEERHEYLDGHIYAMSGESTQHGDISVNLVGELRALLKRTACRVWTKDTKVLCGSVLKSDRIRKGLFAYPNIVVVCGAPQFLDKHRDVVLNPKVIIEVLSPATEAYNRGEKFWRYRRHLTTLTDYFLVSQVSPLVEHFRRQPNEEWVLSTAAGLDASLHIDSIECTLSLSEVYDRVVFPQEETPDPLRTE